MYIKKDVVIVGGGAAGFFAAIQIAEQNPDLDIVILERGKEVLTKVKISGGGRCNVTHAEFIPSELVKNYPRGEKELLGPFHSFCSGDTIEFFEQRGIALKIEEDGRMFPVSDSSQTIIDCFLSEVKRLGIQILKNHSVKEISKQENEWYLQTNQEGFQAKKVLIATGSNPKIWKMLETLEHKIIAPVPSLFTFNIKDNRIKGLAGIAEEVSIKVLDTKLESEGPLLITHWGMSGPAILKLSAWGARELNSHNYQFKIKVNWLFKTTIEEAEKELKVFRTENPKKLIVNTKPFSISKRLWLNFVEVSTISEKLRWADLSKKQLSQLATQLTESVFQVNGKSTFKEEFVTAGGVDLKEINFKTFESKKHENLYFAGEVINIDAITGGFNFQNAWTGAFIAAKAMAY
ncbi:aminoacetone oxidase family FAD-binding enzyme [Flavobacteriaceae bacterium R38]|nr:aminoacetone oxidase family FAD-binding enzyme [Flavobacteriaceae bacterium R38]